MIIQLSGSWGELTLFNIYNNCEKNNTINQLEVYTQELINPTGQNKEKAKPILWLGDFNWHHPHWDNVANTRLFTQTAIDNAEVLISTVAGLGMDLVLPPGIPTHIHNVSKKWTRLDQVFISEDFTDSIITCNVLNKTPGINTDHLPILTMLDLNLTRISTTPPRNFHNVDWETFEETLTAKLETMGPPSHLQSQREIETMYHKLTEAKRWWMKDLTKLRHKANRKGRRVSKYKEWLEHQSHVEKREVNKKFHRTLESTKRQHWHDWLEKADDPDIWTMHKYTSSLAGDRGKPRILVLKAACNGQETTMTTNKEKSCLLAKMFFPPRPLDNTPIQFVYLKLICDFDPISREQIKRQLAKLKPYKAPGPDSIPNIILTKCANMIVDRLYHIYKAIIELGSYYKPWRMSMTVVLHKPGKPHYNTPKAYRPTALLNTMSKVLTVLMVDLMTFYTETHQLLLAHHFGGRPGRTTTDAVHLLVHKIKHVWQKSQVTAVLFLDIEGAFLNTVTSKLEHSMRKRRLPEMLVNFAKLMLEKCSMTLRFDNHMLELILLDNGIGQGDPLSMALYQYYNADILEIPSRPQEVVEAYVDDAILTATASDVSARLAVLKKIS